MNKNIISVVTGGIAGFMIGGISIGCLKNKFDKKEREMGLKMTKYYTTLTNWIEIKQENKSLGKYLKSMGYKTIAIYGMREVGEQLYKELNDTDVTVKYAIDKNAECIFADIDVYVPEDELPLVDVIVVTPTYYYDSIQNQLRGKVSCPIISLDDVIGGAKAMI